MDTLTHAALGACLGELAAGKQLGKKAAVIGAVVNNLPDLDVIAHLWATQSENLLIHRGFSHSILLSVIGAPFLAWLLQRIFPASLMSFRRWLLLIGVNLFAHLFIDAFTAYGVAWFEPFSDFRVSFHTLFIVDPIYTLPLLVAAAVLFIKHRDARNRAAWPRWGLLISTVYLGITVINKAIISSASEKSLASKGVPYNDFFVTPTPLNSFLFYVVAQTPEACYVGYHSVFDPDDEVSFYSINKNDSLLLLPCDTAALEDLMTFSEGYYHVSLIGDTVIFSDLRFGQIGGWEKDNAPFVFNYRLKANCDNRTALQKGRAEAMEWNLLKRLFKRVKGKVKEEIREEKQESLSHDQR